MKPPNKSGYCQYIISSFKELLSIRKVALFLCGKAIEQSNRSRVIGRLAGRAVATDWIRSSRVARVFCKQGVISSIGEVTPRSGGGGEQRINNS